ncbi:hypothetical protein P7C73_g2941, partial [Tremellales sp. Uapishka_1]
MPPSVSLADCCIDASTPFEDIFALLKLRGGIVIKGLLSVEDCQKMDSAVSGRQGPRKGLQTQGMARHKPHGTQAQSKTPDQMNQASTGFRAQMVDFERLHQRHQSARDPSRVETSGRHAEYPAT